ncbi:hypothetical protein SAMN05192529_12034 [Arachidicoccus rhizosphaerae]|uniref:Uncharacterized protein n=1 Tax=Arachidicoccus rhizosphaerae TaxID=551991 RepID=A0A1H4BDZ6_9BACT|nr:hypothetical protein SAMN05192529_12034 [Arachidicoccus rhizosphaerae]
MEFKNHCIRTFQSALNLQKKDGLQQIPTPIPATIHLILSFRIVIVLTDYLIWSTHDIKKIIIILFVFLKNVQLGFNLVQK